MKDKKVHIVKDIVTYGIGSNLSDFVGFFIATLIRRFLGPFYMGIWSLFKVILSYAFYTDMGILNIIYYKVPLYAGKGDDQEVNNIHNTVFSFLWLTNIAGGVILFIGGLLFKEKMPHELFIGFLVLPVVLLLQRFYGMYIALVRAHKKFSLLGSSYLVDSVLNLILVAIFLKIFKIYGIYIVSIILPLADIAYIRLFTDFKLKFQLKWMRLKDYLKFALPVFLSSLLDTVFFSIDRLMIAKSLGMISLGYYSVAIMCKNSAVNFTRSFASVFSPYFIEDYGKTNDISRVASYIFKYTEILSYFMIVILGLVYLVFPAFIRLAMPKFEAGIDATKITIFGIYFTVLSGQFRNLLTVNNKQKYIISSTLFASAICIAFNLIFLRLGLGITGIAISSAFATFILFLLLARYVSQYCETKPFKKFLVLSIVPFLSFLAIFFMIDRAGFMSITMKYILKTTLFLLVSFAIMRYINEKVRLTEVFKAIFAKRRARG